MSKVGKMNKEENGNGFNNFLNACKRMLDILALWKQKYGRSNHMPFMNKALSKEIMTRARLRITFSKHRSGEQLLKKTKEVFKTTQLLCLTSEKI